MNDFLAVCFSSLAIIAAIVDSRINNAEQEIRIAGRMLPFIVPARKVQSVIALIKAIINASAIGTTTNISEIFFNVFILSPQQLIFYHKTISKNLIECKFFRAYNIMGD